MAAIYGTGTLFYGWKSSRGRIATATRWLSVFYLPVLPLGRYRVRLPMPPKKGFLYGLRELLKLGRGPLSVLAWAPVQTECRVIGREPFRFEEAVLTYVKTYLLLPLALAGPVYAIGLGGNLLDQSSELGFWAAIAGLLALAAYYLILIASLLNRARYGPMAGRQ